MKKKYIKEGNFDIRYLSKTDFVFHAVEPNEIIEEAAPAENDKKKKKDKKKRS